jgi:hypothetical protein
MKKSELTQLTQIIEHLVAREVRKQLPAIISETFQNMMGKPVITEQRKQVEIPQEQTTEELSQEPSEHIDFKASLKELFAGTSVMKNEPQYQQQKVQQPPRQFTKNPIFNQILNETTSDLRDRERLVGAAAFQGGYSPSLTMIPGFNPSEATMPMSEEPTFMRNIPTMPGNVMGHSPMQATPPPQMVDGQISNHAPLESLPTGVSVLDMKAYAPASVAGALTRNYSQMMKLIDKKKGKV